jgi:hypothetical protein
MNDIDGWLQGPVFLTTLASFLATVFTALFSDVWGRIFGTTA